MIKSGPKARTGFALKGKGDQQRATIKAGDVLLQDGLAGQKYGFDRG
jgi:hypothetical protein